MCKVVKSADIIFLCNNLLVEVILLYTASDSPKTSDMVKLLGKNEEELKKKHINLSKHYSKVCQTLEKRNQKLCSIQVLRK